MARHVRGHFPALATLSTGQQGEWEKKLKQKPTGSGAEEEAGGSDYQPCRMMSESGGRRRPPP